MLVFVHDERVHQQHQVYLVYVRDALVLDDERISTQRQLRLVLLLAQDERVLYDSARHIRKSWHIFATHSSCLNVSRMSLSRSSTRYS